MGILKIDKVKLIILATIATIVWAVLAQSWLPIIVFLLVVVLFAVAVKTGITIKIANFCRKNQKVIKPFAMYALIIAIAVLLVILCFNLFNKDSDKKKPTPTSPTSSYGEVIEDVTTEEETTETQFQKPIHKPTEKTTEKPSQKPTEKPNQKETEKSSQKPAEKVTQKPSVNGYEIPAETESLGDYEPSHPELENEIHESVGNQNSKPTQEETEKVTQKPTQQETEKITQKPTNKPSVDDNGIVKPTEPQWDKPTQKPTQKPTEKPTEKPTQKPTEKPTQKPTEKPTQKPTEKPTQKPTEKPTQRPTQLPTEEETTEYQYPTADCYVSHTVGATVINVLVTIDKPVSNTIFDIQLDDGNGYVKTNNYVAINNGDRSYSVKITLPELKKYRLHFRVFEGNMEIGSIITPIFAESY